MDGNGGSSTFTLGSSSGMSEETRVQVRVVTLTWGNEITWNIDGGSAFGPFEDNSENVEDVEVAVGPHTIYYFDAYGDGWTGNYYTITDSNVAFLQSTATERNTGSSSSCSNSRCISLSSSRPS